MNFAKTILKARNELDLTQNGFAKHLKVTRQALSMWESGKRTPKLGDIFSIAKALNITFEISKNSIVIKGDLKPLSARRLSPTRPGSGAHQ